MAQSRKRGSSKASTPDLTGFGSECAGDLMTEGVAVVTADESVAEAARLMAEYDCGSLPVVDEWSRPIGFLTDRDIALFIAPRSLDAGAVRVRECMSEDVVACNVHDPLEQCLEVMARNQIRRLPVLNDDGSLAGIISQADLARDASAHAGTGRRRMVASMVSAISEPE
jgi:CBS domain-containing protein